MTLFDALAVLALAAAMMSHAAGKRAQIWDALADIENRKLDKEP